MGALKRMKKKKLEDRDYKDDDDVARKGVDSQEKANYHQLYSWAFQDGVNNDKEKSFLHKTIKREIFFSKWSKKSF